MSKSNCADYVLYLDFDALLDDRAHESRKRGVELCKPSRTLLEWMFTLEKGLAHSLA